MDCKFKYYVMNFNFNKKKVEMFNVFHNIKVYEYTEKEIKKYLRAPKKYHYHSYTHGDFYGFEGLCKHIDIIIRCEEWARCEYEIAVGGTFITELNDVIREVDAGRVSKEELYDYIVEKSKRNYNLEKWDCYQQAQPNIEMIVRECIYQYKEYMKNAKEKS